MLSEHTENQQVTQVATGAEVTQQQGEAMEPEYASAQRRMLAALVDIAAILVLLLPVNWFFDHIVFGDHHFQYYADIYMQMHGDKDSADINDFLNFLYHEGWISKLLLMHFTTLVIIACYVIGFGLVYSSSPGKILCRCLIVDNATGRSIGFKQSVLRFVGYIVSTLVLCLGFVFMHFAPKNRALHDYIAGTVVIIPQNGAKNANLSTQK